MINNMTLKGNIDSKIREILRENMHDLVVYKSTMDEVVSQLKQLMNEFADELIQEDEKPDDYIAKHLTGEELSLAAQAVKFQGRNQLRSEMRERKEKLLK